MTVVVGGQWTWEDQQEIAHALALPPEQVRVIYPAVGGAFHSPLMEPAREELAAAIENTSFSQPNCPIYQNVTAHAVTEASDIKSNLISQLTAPVRWTQSVQQMIADGATLFTEVDEF